MQCCNICEFDYDECVHRPLILPCGHTFCKCCLEQVKISENCVCPICRKDWSHLYVEDLAICFQLLTSLDIEADQCKLHDEELIIWCNTCKTRSCLMCLKIDHADCEWQPYKGLVKRLKNNLLSSLQILDDKLCEVGANLEELQPKRKNGRDILQTLRTRIDNSCLRLGDYLDGLEHYKVQLDQLQMDLEFILAEKPEMPGTDQSNLIISLQDNYWFLKSMELVLPLPDVPILPISNYEGSDCTDIDMLAKGREKSELKSCSFGVPNLSATELLKGFRVRKENKVIPIAASVDRTRHPAVVPRDYSKGAISRPVKKSWIR